MIFEESFWWGWLQKANVFWYKTFQTIQFTKNLLKLNHHLIDSCFFLFLLIFNVHAQFAIMAKSSGLIPEMMFNKRYNALNILFNI